MKAYDFSRVLTTGADGQIGSYVDFGIRTNRQILDITDESAMMNFVKEKKPLAIIHLAGATDMTRCENDPAYAYDLNVRGTYNVARAARAVGATMVYASTSRVFKGDKPTPYTEDDIPEPDTHYGRTKYIGELVVAALVPQHIIARTCWVFGGGPERDNKFYGKIMKQLQSDAGEIVALHDVHGSPTYGKDYINAIKDLLTKEEYGIFHIANEGVATRYEVASAIVGELRPNVTVRPVDRSYYPSGATLPTNESIASQGVKMRPWQEAISEYINDEWTLLH